MARMKTSILLWVIVLSGAGTLLIRLLPMLWRNRTASAGADGRLRRALDAIGPSAIVALLLASFWSMTEPTQPLRSLMPIAAGLLGVALGKRWLKTIAWATLAGVAAYGLALWMLQSWAPVA
jgi:branched-subunit amino acid transport protein